MKHDNTGMMYTGKTGPKTGEPVKKPKSVLDYNKGMVGGGGQNGPAACILPSHEPISEGVSHLSLCHDVVQCIHPVREDHFTEIEIQPVQASCSTGVNGWTDNAGTCKTRLSSS